MNHAAHDTGGVLDRLAAAELKLVAAGEDRMPAKAHNGGLDRDACAGRCLREVHQHGAPGQASVHRSRVGLAGTRICDQRMQRGGVEIADGEEMPAALAALAEKAFTSIGSSANLLE
jgi:hypothetical protein